MPYRFRTLRSDENVEYFEPRIEPVNTTSDIANFIDNLEEPQRAICSSVILDGENISRVAATFHTSSYRINRILRTSLRPLAEDFGIISGRKP